VEILLTLMLGTYRRNKSKGDEVLDHYLAVLLIELASALEPSTGKRKNDDLVHSFMLHLRKNLHRHIPMKELSELFNYHEKYLARLFKQEAGITITSYLWAVRTGKAMELLSSTDWPVSEIALESGYRDLTYFYLLFRKQTGILPGEYRGMNRPV